MPNGSQLYAGRDFYHWTSYEELNFKFTTYLSYEARNPCLRIGDVCALHEQSAPAAKQQKKIQKYNYFWLKQSFEQVFFFQRVQVPYTPWKKWEVLVRRKVVYREVCTEGSDTAKFGTDE